MPSLSPNQLPSLAAIVELEEHLAQAIADVDTVTTALKRRAAAPEYGEHALTEADYGRLAFLASKSRRVGFELVSQADTLEQLVYEIFTGERHEEVDDA